MHFARDQYYLGNLWIQDSLIVKRWHKVYKFFNEISCYLCRFFRLHYDFLILTEKARTSFLELIIKSDDCW